MDQLIADHEKARRGFTKIVQGVDPSRWDAPSPCSEWDARAVVEHVIGFHDALLLKPLEVRADRPREDPVARWIATDAALSVAISDDVLDREIEGPMGTTTARSLLPALTSDVLTHSWDLGRAVGIEVDLDQELVTKGLAMAEKNADQLETSGMFGPRVPVADDAPPADRLLGIFGRDPAWQPPS